MINKHYLQFSSSFPYNASMYFLLRVKNINWNMIVQSIMTN